MLRVLVLGLFGVAVWGQKPAQDWVLTFSEDFAGKELSFPKWTPHDPWGQERNREGQAYVPEAISVAGGMARIVASRKVARYDGVEREFSSGIMTTYGSFAQTYGRFEIRCRVAAGKGVESKFWLMPVPKGETPGIDVLDVVGSDPKKGLFGNRWGDEKTERSYSGMAAVADLSEGFHTVAIEWDEKQITWSVDGKETFQSVSGVPHQGMYLAIGLAVGGATARYPDSSARFPTEFDVQAVRVYQAGEEDDEMKIENRSIQRATVIPVLAYPNVHEAAAWLCEAFGFTVRLKIADHRVQMNVGSGAVTVRELKPEEVGVALGVGHSVTVRVEDADAHCERARARGARITQEPVTFAFGERQYNAVDFAGHTWMFSESVADVHPEAWGGTAVEL